MRTNNSPAGLRRSHKLESLPRNLRTVADKLIATKFPEKKDYSYISIGTPYCDDGFFQEYYCGFHADKIIMDMFEEADADLPTWKTPAWSSREGERIMVQNAQRDVRREALLSNIIAV